MSVLSRKQRKYIDRLFYHERELRSVASEYRAAVVADAADSADPTARQAVEKLAALPEIMGCKDPEGWVHIMDLTWQRYHDDHHIGKCMRGRYQKRESPQVTSMNNNIVESTYWFWREEFLTYAAFMAVKNGLTL